MRASIHQVKPDSEYAPLRSGFLLDKFRALALVSRSRKPGCREYPFSEFSGL
jgi:hypothetical protein